MHAHLSHSHPEKLLKEALAMGSTKRESSASTLAPDEHEEMDIDTAGDGLSNTHDDDDVNPTFDFPSNPAAHSPPTPPPTQPPAKRPRVEEVPDEGDQPIWDCTHYIAPFPNEQAGAKLWKAVTEFEKLRVARERQWKEGREDDEEAPLVSHHSMTLMIGDL
jgi:hypothetical protein